MPVHDPITRKLGRLPAVHPHGMRMLAEVTERLGLPTPPSAVAWYKGCHTSNGYRPSITNWGMLGNDDAGDCVFAGGAHQELLWTSIAGAPLVLTTDQVLSEYSRLTGYVRGDAATDGGAVESQIWEEWRTNGLFGRKIEGFVGVNPKSRVQLKDAVWFFGAAMLGLNLPISCQDQPVWDVPLDGLAGPGEPGSWGGHATLLVGAGERGVSMVTWGEVKHATWEFMAAYCDEAYAMLSTDWLDRSGASPGGVPLHSLEADLRRILVS